MYCLQKNVNFFIVKNLIWLEDVDTDNMHISILVSSGEKHYKYFIGYKNDD